MREQTLEAFKQRLRGGSVLVGMQHSSGSAAIMELLGYAGFDFVIIDMEHTAYSIDVAESLLRAAEVAQLVAFVRVADNRPDLIMQALDAGAVGILVPHIRTASECVAALSSARYMPQGIRGKSSGTRAARWGSTTWSDYERWANLETLVVPILEDREAIENVQSIVAVPGLEVVAVGPGDLAQSYGAPGLGFKSPQVSSALSAVVTSSRAHGIATMTIPVPDLDNAMATQLIAEGVQLIWHAVDLVHIARLFKSLSAVREANQTQLDRAQAHRHLEV